jgi:hypothetical protein
MNTLDGWSNLPPREPELPMACNEMPPQTGACFDGIPEQGADLVIS